MRRIILFFVTCVVSTAIGVRKMEALEVAPAIQEIAVRIGEYVEREIQVSNATDQPMEVFFTVQKFGSAGGGSPAFLPPEDTSGLPEWIRVSHPSVRLAPGSKTGVRVRIDVPRTAIPGGYTAAVFATERTADGATVEITKRIATLWFVTVQGLDAASPEPIWRVERLTTTSLPRGWNTDIDIELVVKNTGSVHGLAAADVRINGIFTRSTSTHVVARVLPEESRALSNLVQVSAPIDRLRIDAVLTNGQRTETSVWILHVRSMIVVFSGLFVAMIGWRWSKRFRRGILST